jgi:hypothetical protein
MNTIPTLRTSNATYGSESFNVGRNQRQQQSQPPTRQILRNSGSQSKLLKPFLKKDVGQSKARLAVFPISKKEEVNSGVSHNGSAAHVPYLETDGIEIFCPKTKRTIDYSGPRYWSMDVNLIRSFYVVTLIYLFVELIMWSKISGVLISILMYWLLRWRN